VFIVVARWVGRLACLAGFVAWSLWLGWRVAAAPLGAVNIIVLVLEVSAFLVSIVLSAALWSTPRRSAGWARSDASVKAYADVYADLLGVAELGSVEGHGADDTGEVARARRGLRLLDPRRRPTDAPPRPSAHRRLLAEMGWAVIAVEGIRRMLFAVVLVAVLLSGRLPFEMPPWSMLALVVGAQLLFAGGHWLLSGGVLRPGMRLRWSMASVGAGFGDGVSRTGLPIRWAATLATMIVLNLAVALRGLSDRWTHGLGPMPHQERVTAMVLSWWLVVVGFAALRTLAQPSLGFYGATRRLEETSTRRLALGTTLVVAMVGFVAGVLPGGLPA
jgi:hypothetical protein